MKYFFEQPCQKGTIACIDGIERIVQIDLASTASSSPLGITVIYNLARTGQVDRVEQAFKDLVDPVRVAEVTEGRPEWQLQIQLSSTNDGRNNPYISVQFKNKENAVEGLNAFATFLEQNGQADLAEKVKLLVTRVNEHVVIDPLQHKDTLLDIANNVKKMGDDHDAANIAHTLWIKSIGAETNW